jgi:ATP-dependent RNA helicase RhlE
VKTRTTKSKRATPKASAAASPTEVQAAAPDVVSATAPTPPGTAFDTLGLSPVLLKAVADSGYTEPSPIQREAIPLILSGRDIIGLAQTGTGKTAAFTLPIADRLLTGPHRLRALVLTPTRELCQQVEKSFKKYAQHTSLVVASVYGGVGYEPQERAMRSGADVIVATPGRLIDHLEKGNVSFDNLEVLVLDEADRMLDMGFAPQLNRLVAAMPSYRQTLLFSATMPPEVEILARKYLRRPHVIEVSRRTNAATTVTHAVYPVPRSRKSALLIELLKQPEMDSVLVFTRMKVGADRVVRDLEHAGISATALHADKRQSQRDQALSDFREGKIRVLVATDIAQRGLDITGISHVINYDVPAQVEDYVHRIGRTGRAAQTGDAYTFMAPDEIAMVRMIERVIGQEIERVSVSGYDFGPNH